MLKWCRRCGKDMEVKNWYEVQRLRDTHYKVTYERCGKCDQKIDERWDNVEEEIQKKTDILNKNKEVSKNK